MKLLTTLTAIWLMMSISGCNTVKGVGQDLQKAGEKIEDAAKKK